MVSNVAVQRSIFFIILISTVFFAPCDQDIVCNAGQFLDASCNCVSSGGPGTTPGDVTMDSGKLKAALMSLCQDVKNMLGVAMMLMVVSAAIVYSIGQVMGAETRARASVWATSMFNGAIIAALIYIIVPWMLNKMLEGQLTVGC